MISDLNWHQGSRKINREDILLLFESKVHGHGERFRSVKKYWDIILSETPDLVLIAGDVTGDGSCGHGFHTAFYYLLILLELSQTPTCFLRGDNDLEIYYSSVTDNLSDFRYVMEISNKAIEVQGLKILGIPYETTAQKKLLRRTLQAHSGCHHDLILCHSPLKRRTFLLDLDCDYLMTGHFDNKLVSFDKKVFISCSNDSKIINYATIHLGKGRQTIHYKFSDPLKRMLIDYKLLRQLPYKNNSDRDSLEIDGIPIPIEEYEEMALPGSSYKKDKNALALAIKYLRGQAYRRSITLMCKLKSGEIESSKVLLDQKMKENITSEHTLSRSMLLDYLGSQVRTHLLS